MSVRVSPIRVSLQVAGGRQQAGLARTPVVSAHPWAGLPPRLTRQHVLQRGSKLVRVQRHHSVIMIFGGRKGGKY